MTKPWEEAGDPASSSAARVGLTAWPKAFRRGDGNALYDCAAQGNSSITRIRCLVEGPLPGGVGEERQATTSTMTLFSADW